MWKVKNVADNKNKFKIWSAYSCFSSAINNVIELFKVGLPIFLKLLI